MARTSLGAAVEMIKREIASRIRRDLVLHFETGPATSDQLTTMQNELRKRFPSLVSMAAGGDSEGLWKVSVCVRPTTQAEVLRQELSRWASQNEPFVRSHSISQRSLWRTA
jgi:hypothetical protein